jgi:hypothetical protein
MRINVYSQELITAFEDRPFTHGKGEVRRLPITELVTPKQTEGGVIYSGVRLYLHSPDHLHARADDDRSALTFWLPASAARRSYIADSFEQLAKLVREATKEEK